MDFVFNYLYQKVYQKIVRAGKINGNRATFTILSIVQIKIVILELESYFFA